MALAAREALAARASVRVFTWKPPAISWGRQQPLPDWALGLRGRAGGGLELVERPTGGGIAWHGSDVSVSMVAPRAGGWTLSSALCAACESAARLCEDVGAPASILWDAPARQRIACCLAEPSPYAVVSRGRKVAGFAARRYPEAWLIQGSLLVRSLPAALREHVPAEALAGTDRNACSLEEAAGRLVAPAEAAGWWTDLWRARVMQEPGGEPVIAHAL